MIPYDGARKSISSTGDDAREPATKDNIVVCLNLFQPRTKVVLRFQSLKVVGLNLVMQRTLWDSVPVFFGGAVSNRTPQSPSMDKAVLCGKFRACALTALAGDCLGEKFEAKATAFTSSRAAPYVLQHAADNSEKKYLMYTDDTAMALSLFDSLLKSNGFSGRDLVKRYAMTFFEDKPRAYGFHVREVFEDVRDTLKSRKFILDPYAAAQRMFEGQGSYGNGSAMRVYPVALFYPRNLERTIEVAMDQSRCTHTHMDGILGAVLQAVSVHFALNATPGATDAKQVASELLMLLRSTVQNLDPANGGYFTKLDLLEKLLSGDEPPSLETVVRELGTHISAIKSVPTAIFCFLYCIDHQTEIENPLLRTIAYAISLGGDTDTIATMAGAIAGAFYGDCSDAGKPLIPDSWYQLEGANRVVDLTERAFSRIDNARGSLCPKCIAGSGS